MRLESKQTAKSGQSNRSIDVILNQQNNNKKQQQNNKQTRKNKQQDRKWIDLANAKNFL